MRNLASKLLTTIFAIGAFNVSAAPQSPAHYKSSNQYHEDTSNQQSQHGANIYTDEPTPTKPILPGPITPTKPSEPEVPPSHDAPELELPDLTGDSNLWPIQHRGIWSIKRQMFDQNTESLWIMRVVNDTQIEVLDENGNVHLGELVDLGQGSYRMLFVAPCNCENIHAAYMVTIFDLTFNVFNEIEGNVTATGYTADGSLVLSESGVINGEKFSLNSN